jgi:hypothetical protein
MGQVAWTDERLGERFDSIDRRFDVVDRRFDVVDRRFDRLEDEIGGLREAMLDLHRTLSRSAVGVIVALFGVIITLLAKGA